MDEFIDKLIAFREEKRMLESKLNEAEHKYEKMSEIASYNEEKYHKCDLEKRRLSRECDRWRTDYLRLKDDYNAEVAKCSSLGKTITNLSAENKTLKEENSILKKESNRRLLSYSERREKTIAVRELVEQLIIYAERENKSTAREIRIALEKKMANGFVPSEALTPEYKQRLDNLGRENPIIIHNTSYNYSSGSTHHDNRRTLSIERRSDDIEIRDKL